MKKQISPSRHKHKVSRDNPDGDSILQKERVHLQGLESPIAFFPKTRDSPNVAGKSRKRLSQRDSMAELEDQYLARKAKTKYVDVSFLSDHGFDASIPDTLSQISAIAPEYELTQMSESFTKKKLPSRSDATWEMAVERARGQPDGADLVVKPSPKNHHPSPKDRYPSPIDRHPSPRAPKISPAVQKHSEVSGKENKVGKVSTVVTSSKVGKFERKKSLRIKVQSAAQKLKKKAMTGNKSKLNQSTTSKRKFEETLPDETVINIRRAKVKDMTWKERRMARKLNKNNATLIQKAKAVWETLRRHNLPEEQRHKLCQELFSSMREKLTEMAYAHDTARIIQCLAQYGSMDLRFEIMDLLKDHLVTICKSKYGKFIVRKLLRYGSKQLRSQIYKGLHGHIRKLLRHREACDVVEYAYNQYANALQRLTMLEEFYGPTFTLFKTLDTKSLEQIMVNQPDKRDMILSNMKEALLPLIDKDILVHSMVHKIFFEFFCFANDKMRTEMIEALREGVIHMVHTRDGARVAMYCLWHGTVKDRKMMIKSFKTHVVKMCKEEYGHLVLLALFDVVDDTRIVQKIILDEMIKSLPELAVDQYARKVLLYLLSPRDPLHFHPNIVHILEEGDSNIVSKKDESVRHRELLEHISPHLLSLVQSSTRQLVTSNASLLLVLAIIQHSIGNTANCMEAVAQMAVEPFTAGDPDKFHIIEDPAGHLMLKKLILSDKERLQAGNEALFTKILLDLADDGCLKSWAACNRGCFILISLLELDDAEIQATVLEQMTGIKKNLKKMTMKGAQILLQKLDSLSPGKVKMIAV